MSVKNQILLKRHEGTTIEEFRKHYIQRHGRLAIPWFLDSEVTHYAQIHNIQWASEESQQKYPNIDLADWDAVAEVAFPGDQLGTALGKGYYENVILPDERELFYDEASKHMAVVEAGSINGERFEFIVNGKAVRDFEEWKSVWEEWARKDGDN